MRPISRRHKLLGVALGVVATGWLVDFFAGGGKPATVRAAVPPESTPTADTMPADNVPDLDELLSAVEGAPTALPDLELNKLTRDPFVPTTVLKAACRVAGSERVEEAAEREDQPSTEVPFEQRHRLQGVLTGQRPLAFIDGKLFAVGARLEDYTLIRIERDQVVCQRGERQVVLTLGEAAE